MSDDDVEQVAHEYVQRHGLDSPSILRDYAGWRKATRLNANMIGLLADTLRRGDAGLPALGGFRDTGAGQRLRAGATHYGLLSRGLCSVLQSRNGFGNIVPRSRGEFITLRPVDLFGFFGTS
jgi:hypothetical protein